MRVAEVANRYAKALYDIGAESKKADAYYGELKAVEDVFNADETLQKFVLCSVNFDNLGSLLSKNLKILTI